MPLRSVESLILHLERVGLLMMVHTGVADIPRLKVAVIDGALLIATVRAQQRQLMLLLRSEISSKIGRIVGKEVGSSEWHVA